jgi:nucleotide-binding universal stress UspA family protein
LGDYELVQKMEDALRKGGKEIVEKAESEIRVKGVKHFHSAVLLGDPATEIIRYAKENGVDMIVMGSRGEGTLEGLLFGSVSQKVCDLASCTCVTVK